MEAHREARSPPLPAARSAYTKPKGQPSRSGRKSFTCQRFHKQAGTELLGSGSAGEDVIVNRINLSSCTAYIEHALDQGSPKLRETTCCRHILQGKQHLIGQECGIPYRY